MGSDWVPTPEATPRRPWSHDLNALQQLVEKGQPNGYAALDADGHVPADQVVLDDVRVINDAPLNPTHVDQGDAVADGRDNTSAMNAALAKLSGVNDGAIYLPGGDWRFDDLVIGDGTTGRKVKVFGDGPATLLRPYTPSSRLLTVNGLLSGVSDYFSMEDVKVLQTQDRVYSDPLIRLFKVRNYFLKHVDIAISGAPSGSGFTGTFLGLDSTYNGTIEQCNWLGGRHAVPVEVYCSVSQNTDSLVFNNTFNGGAGPIIIRSATGGVRHIYLRHKMAASSPDFGAYWETVLSADTAASQAYFDVPAGAGASITALDPVIIGKPSLADYNRVDHVVSGGGVGGSDRVYLAQPMPHAHSASEMVLGHGCGLITADLFKIHSDSHYEGIPVGWLMEGGRAYYACGDSSAGEFIRMYGGPGELRIGEVVAGGSGDGTPGKPKRNVFINRAAGIPTGTPTRIRLDSVPTIPSGSPAITYRGGDWTDVSYEHWRANSGHLEHVQNVIASASGSTRVRRVRLGSRERFSQSADGGLWGTPGGVGTVLSPPVLASVDAAAGGGLAPGTYYYVITALNASGETIASNEIAVVIGGANGTANLVWGSNPAGATSERIYRGRASGVYDCFYDLGNAVSTTFSDVGATGAGSPIAGSPPTVNLATYSDTSVHLSTNPGQIQVGKRDASGNRGLNMSLGADSSARLSIQFANDSTSLGIIYNESNVAKRLRSDFCAIFDNGVGGAPLGTITGLTSAQIDALHPASAFRDGIERVALSGSSRVHIYRDNGKWQQSAAYTQIA